MLVSQVGSKKRSRTITEKSRWETHNAVVVSQSHASREDVIKCLTWRHYRVYVPVNIEKLAEQRCCDSPPRNAVFWSEKEIKKLCRSANARSSCFQKIANEFPDKQEAEAYLNSQFDRASDKERKEMLKRVLQQFRATCNLRQAAHRSQLRGSIDELRMACGETSIHPIKVLITPDPDRTALVIRYSDKMFHGVPEGHPAFLG